MNAQEMLDHAFGQLDSPAREHAEAEIGDDPRQAESFDRLVRSINQLLDDGQAFVPPPDLASRTMAFVSENRRRKRSLLDFVPVTVPFRWADVAVAAGILCAGLLTLGPALHRSKERSNLAACMFNLQRLGVGLAQYGHRHQAYPYCAPDCPESATGTFAAMLNDSGLLDDPSILDCPCDGKCSRPPLPENGSLCDLKVNDPARYQQLLCWDYAYHAGHRDSDGRPHPLSTPCAMNMPLLADEPPHDARAGRILPGNSPNHRGLGQNVLFADLHVGWHNTRRLGPDDPDMYLNDVQQPAAGLRANDAVLLPSLFPFGK